MEKNYIYQNVEDINVDSNIVQTIMFKPVKAPIICFVAGVAMLFINILLFRILGAFFILMAIVVYFGIKDKKVVDVHEKGLVIYNSSNQSLAYYLDFNDIKMWEVNHDNGHDSIIFTLTDNQRAVIDTFQIEKAYDAIDKQIHDKEKRAIEAKKNKEKHWEIRNPLKNWFKK